MAIQIGPEDTLHEARACYNDTTEGWMRTLECSCGFAALGDSWETAGQIYDEHLMEINSVTHAALRRSSKRT